MNRLMSFVILAILPVAVLTAAADATYLEIAPSIGPSSSSAYWTAYRSNAIAGLKGDVVVNTGNPSDYFPLMDPITPDDMSGDWRLLFGLKIVAEEGGKVRLSDVVYKKWSTDSGPIFSASTLYTYATAYYSSAMVGVNNGSPVTSGAGTQWVDAIYLTGTALAFSPTQRALADERAPFTINVKYGLGSLDGPDVVESSVQIIPEPGTIGFLSIGLVLLRRRK